MRALSLCSGIGGLDIAAEMTGVAVVALCERDRFCRRVLQARWPEVPIYEDICAVTALRLAGDGLLPLDLIYGGIPCQSHSVA